MLKPVPDRKRPSLASHRYSLTRRYDLKAYLFRRMLEFLKNRSSNASPILESHDDDGYDALGCNDFNSCELKNLCRRGNSRFDNIKHLRKGSKKRHNRSKRRCHKKL